MSSTCVCVCVIFCYSLIVFFNSTLLFFSSDGGLLSLSLSFHYYAALVDRAGSDCAALAPPPGPS